MSYNNYSNNNRHDTGSKNNSGGGLNKNQQPQPPKPEISITKDTYVDDAEKVIKYLMKCGYKLTTSKIRNILAMTADIYNQILDTSEPHNDNLSDELNDKINYLRIKCIYEAGREKDVKAFIDASKIAEQIQNIKGSKAKFIQFNHYMEALVAYHRYLGGQD